jgi:hypothetical protein
MILCMNNPSRAHEMNCFPHIRQKIIIVTQFYSAAVNVWGAYL